MHYQVDKSDTRTNLRKISRRNYIHQAFSFTFRSKTLDTDVIVKQLNMKLDQKDSRIQLVGFFSIVFYLVELFAVFCRKLFP